MQQDATRTFEVEEALVGHWSHFGRWPRGVLVEEQGTLRYETPIPYLPYNGVIRTRIEGDPDAAIASVVETFRRRGVSSVWWLHPTATPQDLGDRLAAHGFSAVERATGMSLDLAGWSPPPLPDGAHIAEVLSDDELRAYGDLIVGYWELPEEARDFVHEVNAFWGPGRAPVHRWIARLDGIPVGKTLLSLAAPPGVAAIYGMSVRPEARGRGIAGGLATVAIARAKELGCERVVLHSTELAVPVYERAGFEPVCPLTAYADAPLWASRHR